MGAMLPGKAARTDVELLIAFCENDGEPVHLDGRLGREMLSGPCRDTRRPGVELRGFFEVAAAASNLAGRGAVGRGGHGGYAERHLDLESSQPRFAPNRGAAVTREAGRQIARLASNRPSARSHRGSRHDPPRRAVVT